MTHDAEQEHTADGEPSDRPAQAGADREVLAGPGGAEPERAPGGLRGRWARRSAHARAVAAATTVAVLALGGAVGYAATSENSGGEALGAASGSASGSASASASPDGRGDGPADRPGRGPWWGPGGDAVHGESTVRDRDSGAWVVRVWQRGTVEKADGDQITVQSEDGTTWTWTVGADVRVFPGDGDTSGPEALKKGDAAYLVGTRSDAGTRTARHVLSGNWEEKGLGDWRDRIPGHRFREGETPGPSGSGAPT